MPTRHLWMLPCALAITACASVPPTGASAAWGRTPSARLEPLAADAGSAGAANDRVLEAASLLPQQPQGSNSWRQGEAAMQGYLGVTTFEVGVEGGRGALQDNDESFPTLGGGAQWKLAGKGVDLGVEGLLEMAGRAGMAGFAAGTGGASVYVDFDLLMFNLYGGPFVSLPLGNAARLYGAAGPMLQWAFYDQDSSISAANGDGAGFGFGYYARAGFEFATSRSQMFGVGVRWSETTADLDGGFGDLELSGLQWFVSMTQGF